MGENDLYNYVNIKGKILMIYRISSKRHHRGYYLFQCYRNVATIRGQLLFEMQTSRLLFISALLQCGNYLRVATIRGAVFIRGNTVIIFYNNYLYNNFLHFHLQKEHFMIFL